MFLYLLLNNIIKVGKRACLISGGGIWTAYNCGTLERIDNNYDLVVSISTGNLIAPFVALNDWNTLKNVLFNINDWNFFYGNQRLYHPNRNYKRLQILPILLSLFLKKKYKITSKNIYDLINTNFTEKHYFELIENNKEVVIGAINYAQIPAKIHYFNSKYVEFNDFKDWMWGGANNPFYLFLLTKGWKDSNNYFHVGKWGNGGIIELVNFDMLFNKNYTEIDVILTRTKPYEIFENNNINSINNKLQIIIDTIQHNLEFSYFYEKIKILNKQGAKITVYWLPNDFDINISPKNKKSVENLWKLGYDNAFNMDRIDVYNPINCKKNRYL